MQDPIFKRMGSVISTNINTVKTELQNNINQKVNTDQLGVPNGVATLDATGIISSTQLPAMGASTLNNLTDVNLTSPTNNQILKFSEGQWVNAYAPISVGGGVNDPLAKPSSVSYAYDVEGRVDTITSVISNSSLVETYTYNSDGMVHQVISTYNGGTTIETFTYNDDGTVNSTTSV